MNRFFLKCPSSPFFSFLFFFFFTCSRLTPFLHRGQAYRVTQQWIISAPYSSLTWTNWSRVNWPDSLTLATFSLRTRLSREKKKKERKCRSNIIVERYPNDCYYPDFINTELSFFYLEGGYPFSSLLISILNWHRVLYFHIFRWRCIELLSKCRSFSIKVYTSVRVLAILFSIF